MTHTTTADTSRLFSGLSAFPLARLRRRRRRRPQRRLRRLVQRSGRHPLPEPCRAIADAAAAGDAARAVELSNRLMPLWNLFFDHGSYRVVSAVAEELGPRGAPEPAMARARTRHDDPIAGS